MDVVGNGKEAWDSIARVRYDMCFMDLFMPVRDGPETTREIRQKEKENGQLHLPIVGVSSGGEEERQLCLQSGADDYMQKPMHPEILLQMVEKWISCPFMLPTARTNAPPNETVSAETVMAPLPSPGVALKPSTSVPASAPLRPLDRTVRVLLAEDNRANQLALTRLMQSEGCLVVAAMNGEEALEAIKQSHASGVLFDLVFMDMHMPIMDGLTATKAIREFQSKISHPWQQRVPIIGLTASHGPQEEAHCLNVGMDTVGD